MGCCLTYESLHKANKIVKIYSVEFYFLTRIFHPQDSIVLQEDSKRASIPGGPRKLKGIEGSNVAATDILRCSKMWDQGAQRQKISKRNIPAGLVLQIPDVYSCGRRQAPHY